MGGRFAQDEGDAREREREDARLPAPATFRTPGRKEVARLATRRIAIVEQTVRGDGVTGRDERERPEEGGAGPGLRLPVVPVPVGRRNEDDIQPVRPVRPAEFSGDLGPPIAVAPAEEDEDAHPLAFRKTRRVPGNTVPEADDGAVPPPCCNVHEVHEGIRAHTRKCPRRHQPRTDNSRRNRHHTIPLSSIPHGHHPAPRHDVSGESAPHCPRAGGIPAAKRA